MTGSQAQRGFSLVELITVMSIMAILLSLAVLGYSNMQKKGMVERDVATIYSNLMTVRLQAMYTKTPRTVLFSGKTFSIYSSDIVTVSPVATVNLSYPVVTSSSANRVEYDASGMMLKAERSICVDLTGTGSATPADNPGNVDSVDIGAAKIYMGKRKSGGTCVPGNIDQK